MHATIRNVGGYTTTMYSACGDTVQINAGFHGKIDAKFLHDYDGMAVLVLERPEVAKPVAAVIAAPTQTYPIDASAKTSTAEDKAEKK